jgi:hypothetical protein
VGAQRFGTSSVVKPVNGIPSDVEALTADVAAPGTTLGPSTMLRFLCATWRLFCAKTSTLVVLLMIGAGSAGESTMATMQEWSVWVVGTTY